MKLPSSHLFSFALGAVATTLIAAANAEVSFEATGNEPVMAVQFFAGQGPESKYDGWAIER